MGCLFSFPCRKDPIDPGKKSIVYKKRLRDQKLKEDEKALFDTARECCDEPDTASTSDRNAYLRSLSCLSPLDQAAFDVAPEEYEFPFENLVFEGGGNKGLAYVGTIQYLQEIKVLGQIKRLAGSSAGAIAAALVALGYNHREIYDFLSGNIEDVFLDHSCGYLSLLPNLLNKFGWNPGNKIHKWFGERIKTKTESKNPDLTFYELYKEKKVELCVVITNLNQMTSEYCHPKTTPDMPIRDALRMSMSIPGVFTARKYNNHGQEDIYVDGGVLCNYPIHCYDGWYLSMAREDAFLKRCHPLKDVPTLMASRNRFGDYNRKTLGVLLYDDTELEVMRYSLEKRLGSKEPEKPAKETPLYKQKLVENAMLKKAEREHSSMVRAVDDFMKVLHKHNLSEQEYIDKQELENALNDTENFSPEQADLLFDGKSDVDAAFSILDADGSGRIAFLELIHFIEERGVRLQTRFQGYKRREVKTFVEFLSALQNTLLTNLKFVFVKVDEKASDEDRTIGINTGHVQTNDYNMQDEDRQFVVERGYHAAQAFFKYYVARNPDTPKKSNNGTANH